VSRFYEQDVSARLKQRRALGAFLEALIKARRPDIRTVDLRYIFCSDAYLHNINLQFLRHDDFTDIITFDLTDKPGNLQGEIYISVDRVAENAQIFNTSYDRELHRVIFHGAMHLCGLGDKSPAEQQAMRAAEDAALEAWYSENNR
jgi:rRNA maturation RNase YbeY